MYTSKVIAYNLLIYLLLLILSSLIS